MSLKLDHVVVRVDEITRCVEWYKEILGLAEHHRADGMVFLGCGGELAWDVALCPGGSGLDHVGYSVEGEDELSAIVGKLVGAGVPTSELIRQSEPGVAVSVRVELPTGHCMELLVPEERVSYTHPANWQRDALHSPSDLDHITLGAVDLRRVASFLQQHLGFRISDVWEPSPDVWAGAWLRSGALHHDFAILALEANGLHHVAFAVTDLSGLRDFADRLVRCGLRAEYGIGRHGPGGNLFLYIRDPSNNRIELTAEMPIVNGDETRIWRGAFEDIVSLWAAYPPPSSFSEST